MTEPTKTCWSPAIRFGCKRALPAAEFGINAAICHTCKKEYYSSREDRIREASFTVFGGLTDSPPRDQTARAILSRMEKSPRGKGVLLEGVFSAGGIISWLVRVRRALDPGRDQLLELILVDNRTGDLVSPTDLWIEDVDGVKFLSGRVSDSKGDVRLEIRRQGDYWVLYAVNGPVRA
jgi:hypothetical protein